MQIDSKTTIAGVPIIKVRGALRRSDGVFYAEDFTQRLKQPQGRAGAVLNELTIDGRGCSPPTSTEMSGTSWRPTAMPSPEPPLDSRSREIQHKGTGRVPGTRRGDQRQPAGGVGARKLVLFGSFLDPNIERVGDVDLAVEMVPPHQLTKEQFDAVMRRWIHGRRRV